MPEENLTSQENIAKLVKEGYEHYYNQRYFPAIDSLMEAQVEILKLLDPNIHPAMLRSNPEAAPTMMTLFRSLVFDAADRFVKENEAQSNPVSLVSDPNLAKSLMALHLPRSVSFSPVPGSNSEIQEESDPLNSSSVNTNIRALFNSKSGSIPKISQLMEELTAKNEKNDPGEKEPGNGPALRMLLHNRLIDLPSNTPEGIGEFWLQLYQQRIHAENLDAPDTRFTLSNAAFNIAQLYYFDIPMGLGAALSQAGQQFDQVIAYYNRVKDYPFLNLPIETPRLWLQMAGAYLLWGDSLYRAGNLADARQKYEQIIRQNAPPADSILYDGSLAIMRAKVSRYLTDRPEIIENIDPSQFPPDIISLLLTVRQRLLQLDNNLNFLGYSDDYVPILSFDYLQGAARAFAQFAAQANREYISYRQRAEEQTQNINQLEQLALLNEKGIEIEEQRWNEARLEVNSAAQAEHLAYVRTNIAQNNYTQFWQTGWEIARLDAAQAWSGAAAVGSRDEINQIFKGLSDLGIQERAMPRSELTYELAWQRARRAYSLEVDRLRGTVQELQATQQVARTQTALSQARLQTTQTSIEIAQWRAIYSRSNLTLARSNEISPALFNDLAIQVRETAQIYLRRAIEAAFLMQAAYEFENGVKVKRIRLDYGDMNVTNGLYAADLLLRDIDYFTFDKLLNARTKAQPAARVFSLRNDFPLQFIQLQRFGKMQFQTILEDFHEELPGIYNARIKNVELSFEGLLGQTGPVGQLVGGGVSKFRGDDGSIKHKVHNSETLLLSRYSARRDALVADIPSTQLRIFENIGVECSWELELPKRINPFDYRNITDVKIIISYLCQHDPALEAADKAGFPAQGSGQYDFSLRFGGGSDLWTNLERTGSADFILSPALIPSNQHLPHISDIAIIATKKDSTVIPLEIHFFNNRHGTAADIYRTENDGVIRVEKSASPGIFSNAEMLDEYKFILDPQLNPGLAGVEPGKVLNLTSINNIEIVFQYTFDYQN